MNKTKLILFVALAVFLLSPFALFAQDPIPTPPEAPEAPSDSEVREQFPVPIPDGIFSEAKDPRDVVTALEAGADDFLVKPFDPQELRSRLAVGRRILKLESALADKVAELQQALTHVKQLQGLLPICMHCRKVRDDRDTWQRIETYLAQHSELRFTHSLCGSCRAEHYPTTCTAEPEKV